jgi:type I restriction enzyme, S subunit
MPVESDVRWVPVGELGEVRMGKQLSPASLASGTQLPYLRVANVYEGRITYDDIKSMGFSATEQAVYKLLPGDILLNEGQENLGMVGRSAIYERQAADFYFQNTLIRFRPGPKVLPEFAQAVFVGWRRHGVFANVAEKTSISHLGGSRFARIPFPELRLSEQRRIVEALNSVSAVEVSIKASIDKLHAIRRGVIGQLACHDRVSFSHVVASGPQNGLYKPASSYGISGTPIVRINSFSGGPSDLARGLLRVGASSQEIKRYGLVTGDVLINRVNTPGLVGKATIVARLSESTVFESNVMRCELDSQRAVPEFVEAWLSSDVVKAYFLRRAKSAVSQASINRADVLAIPFPDVAPAEQRKFLEQLASIDGMVRAEESELAKFRKLRQGLCDDVLPGAIEEKVS